jgi:hypothetical protein
VIPSLKLFLVQGIFGLLYKFRIVNSLTTSVLIFDSSRDANQKAKHIHDVEVYLRNLKKRLLLKIEEVLFLSTSRWTALEFQTKRETKRNKENAI